MKKLFLLLAGIALIMNACKKDDDNKDDEDKFASITVTADQEAFVLLSTATWCPHCADWAIPAFEDALTGQDGIDASKVNGFSLHYSGSDPLFKQMADDIKSDLGVGGTPGLWIDFDSQYSNIPTSWKNAIKSRQAGTNAPCGVALKVEKNGNSATIYAKVRFFTPTTGNYNIAVYVVESGLVAQQSTPSGSDPNYVHNYVLRDEATGGNTYGSLLFNGSSADVYQVTVNYTASPEINMNNVKFVAVIYEMNGATPVSSPNSDMK